MIESQPSRLVARIPALALLALLADHAGAQALCDRSDVRLGGRHFSNFTSPGLCVTGEFAFARGNHASAQHQGPIFVLERRRGSFTWEHVQELDVVPGQPEIGHAIACSGTVLVTAASSAAAGAFVNFYDHDPASGRWRLSQVEAPDVDPIWPARDVCVDGDYAAVGSPQAGRGEVLVYERGASGAWREHQRLVAPNGTEDTYFGVAVAIAGDVLAVGSFDLFAGGLNGSVLVYRRHPDTGDWRRQQRLVPSSSSTINGFGVSIALDRGRMLVGASAESAAYFFEASPTGTWSETQRVPSPAETNGFALTLDLEGDLASIATPTLANNRVYLYGFDGSSWSLVDEVAARSPTQTHFGVGLALADGTLAVGTSSDPLDLGPVTFLRPCTPLGSSFCGPAPPSSTGASARLGVNGTGRLPAPFELRGTGLPPAAPGLFLAGTVAGFVPHPAGSQGNLCLAGPIARFQRPGELRAADAGGELALLVESDDLPGVGAISAGETWLFQLWYRDANPGPTTNFTDGVSVTFPGR